MSLFEEHKTERRTRIMAAAKKLVVKHGYAGLTMRDLAVAARVSVPTLYNLFGSKDAILVAELEAIAGSIAQALPVTGESFMQRGMVVFDAGMTILEASPEFFRAVIQMFLTSPETDRVRRRVEQGFVMIMEANLRNAQAAGQLTEWAEPAIIARHMFAQHMAGFLAWGLGQLDFATFRAATMSGCAHLIAGVARGPFRDEVEAQIRSLRGVLKTLIDQEASNVAVRR
jgi:AcrR family transcriptional regulator